MGKKSQLSDWARNHYADKIVKFPAQIADATWSQVLLSIEWWEKRSKSVELTDEERAQCDRALSALRKKEVELAIAMF